MPYSSLHILQNETPLKRPGVRPLWARAWAVDIDRASSELLLQVKGTLETPFGVSRQDSLARVKGRLQGWGARGGLPWGGTEGAFTVSQRDITR